TKPQSRHRLEILERTDLARRVPREGHREFIGGDTAAVVAHPNEAGATALHVDLDAPRAGIQTVLDELLDDGGGPLDHLAGGDLIDELAGKNADGHGDSRTPRAVRQGPQPARAEVYQPVLIAAALTV